MRLREAFRLLIFAGEAYALFAGDVRRLGLADRVIVREKVHAIEDYLAALTHALETLIDDAPRRRALGRAAQVRAREQFSAEVIVPRYEVALPPVVPVTAPARARGSVTLTRRERCGMNLAGRRP